MKTKSLIVCAAALLLASCANEDLVTPVKGDKTDPTPIGFQIKVGNMSRATGTNLVTVSPDFGVWAVKGDNQTSAFDKLTDENLAAAAINIENVVMRKYLVGYYNASDAEGYIPRASQYTPASVATPNEYWYYEGLGSDDFTEGKYLWKNITGYTYTRANSSNANQYLKYWDKSSAYTYFYGYAPYSANVALKVDSKVPYVDFGAVTGATTAWNAADNKIDVTAGTSANMMYACQCVPAASYGSTVPLQYNRLLSQIRLGFYETVAGYKVEVVGFSTALPTIVFAPTTATTDAGVTTYAAGTYVKSANASVKFNEATTGTLTPTMSLTSTTSTTGENFLFAPDALTNLTGGCIGTVKTTASYTNALTVIPGQTVGFTLNITLKFIAEDTGEVFYVYGAKAYVNPIAWDSNKLYTYLFHITKKVGGSTFEPGTPEPGYGPDTESGLLPIVFEGITVEDLTEVENEYTINP